MFVTEDLLLHGIGDEGIFVIQGSQIMKHDENTTFNDIIRMSRKPICVVVNSQELEICLLLEIREP